MKKSILLACVIAVHLSDVAAQSALRDPAMRDEDLSATVISVAVNRLPSGHYEYRYSLAETAHNKGTIRDLAIDVSCGLDFGTVSFSEPPYQHERPSNSSDGKHVPLQAYGVTGHTAYLSVTADNRVAWLVWVRPGETVTGLRILSPAPPGPRSFALIPNWDTEGWDYEPYEETGGVPRSGDFVVTGVTTGPACATDPVEEPVRFPGTSPRGLPGGTLEQLNWLLSYSEPLRDRMHLPAGTATYPITIHYAETIDPGTFKVEPPHLRSLFNPRPGTSEQVIVPLDQLKAKLTLEVRPQGEPPGKAVAGPKKGEPPAAPAQGEKLGHSLGNRKDRDVFEFRVEPASPENRKRP